jgi:hypothetical protein
MMYTPPMRDPDTNAIVNADGSGPYDPEDPSDAWEVTGDASVLHLMVRSEAEDERNYPPFDFYMAVRYEDTASTETMFTSHMTYAEMLAMSAEEVIEAAWPGWDWEALSEGAEPPERPVYPPCDENDDWDGDGHDRIACGGDDCADNDINRYPGNPERADFECLDEDCDPLTIAYHDTIYLSGRSQFIPRPLLIQWQDGDEDGDGFIDERVCNHWSGDYGNWGEVFRGNDCDDNNPAVNPLQTEICNGMDDDCDGRIDEGLTMTAYPDNDGDLFGDPAHPTQMCPHEVHSGWVNNNTDCDDTDATVNPINGNCT